MKKNKRLTALAGIAALSLLTAGCGSSSDKNADAATVQTENVQELTEETESRAEENDKKAQAVADAVNYKEIESQTADCKITLQGDDAECDGSGAEFTEGTLRITKAGCYEITGELKDGKIEVDAGKEDKVEIIFNGVCVTCSDYAPFVVWQADEALVYLVEGTVNQFIDGGSYYTPDENETDSESESGAAAEETPSAAFFSKDDLGISGKGTLIVTANCNDGITGKDDLWFTDGVYQVTASDDGIVGKDSIAVKDGDFTIEAGGDGMKSTKEEDEEKGFVAIEGGSFAIDAENDAIQASTYVWVEGGNFDVKAGGGSESIQPGTGMMDRGGAMSDMQTDDGTSAKGLKACVALSVRGGTFMLDCADDALHSNDTLTVSGGTFTMKSGDDGIHGDNGVVIVGGTIEIEESYEGIEAESIIIRDGKIDVTASDDGLNAANGESAEGMDGPGGGMPGMGEAPEDRGERPEEMGSQPGNMGSQPGSMGSQPGDMGEPPEGMEGQPENMGSQSQDMSERPEGMEGQPGNMGSQSQDMGERPEGMEGQPGSYDTSCLLVIEGGELYVNADGDGLDSNGSIIMSGGTVYIDGPVNDGNGILDYGNELIMDGGTLIGAGSSGMLQSVSENSQQPGLAVVFDSTQEAGTKITLKDSNGKEIMSYEPSKTFNAAVISNGEMKLGETYELYLGNEKYASIELSSISTSNGDKGMQNGMKGGGRASGGALPE